MPTPFFSPDRPCTLFLIRHGEIEETYQRIFGGCRIDMGLSPLGLRQAEAAGRWMDAHRVDRLYASPMRRAQLTLAPMAARKGLTPVNLADLREVDFGEWTGCAWDELKARFGVDARDWLTQLDSGRVKDAETGDQLLARVAPCLRRILDESAGQSAAVVCHGGIVRALLALLLQIPLPKTACFRVEYGSITTVHIQPDKVHRVEIEHLNVRPLEGAGAVRDL